MAPGALDRLDWTRPVVVLTGAGISAESGVPTFRGAGGIWRQWNAADLATPQAFRRDPRLVWEFYDWRRQIIAACNPNPAHHTLAAMEQVLPRLTLITQNVDGLHQRAGSWNVIPLHGDIWHLRCTRCHYRAADHRVYTPELIEGFIDRGETLGLSEVVLMDIDPERRAVVGGFARRMVAHAGAAFRLEVTGDRAAAIDGASFVMTQVRVGGQRAGRWLVPAASVAHGAARVGPCGDVAATSVRVYARVRRAAQGRRLYARRRVTA